MPPPHEPTSSPDISPIPAAHRATDHDAVARELGQSPIPAVGSAFEAEFLASRRGQPIVVYLDGDYWFLRPREEAPRWLSPIPRFHWVLLG